MKRFLLLFLVAGFCALAPSDARAQCEPDISGPFYFWISEYYIYDIDRSCYDTTGGVSQATNSCGVDGWDFDVGSPETATYSFIVGSEVIDPTKWTASTRVEFNDPNDSWWNQVSLTVYVYPSGGGVNSFPMFSWNGTNGDLNGCSLNYDYFTAYTGDTVVIEIEAHKFWSNTTIRASTPKVFNQNI